MGFKIRFFFLSLLLIIFSSFECNNLFAEPFKNSENINAFNPEMVSFPSEGLILKGFLFKPQGKPPFPTIIYNHGSEKNPGSRAELAEFYTKKGFVFFLPHRHGQGKSPGAYMGDLQEQLRKSEKDKKLIQRKDVELHELYNKDVIAAFNWIKKQKFVDPDKIFMSGVSYGGIQTLLTAEKEPGIRAYIPFAPGAMSWSNQLLQNKLKESVNKAKAPIFLIQAENDFSLGPSQELGKILNEKGNKNKAKLYPAFGKTHEDGHHGFASNKDGIAIWGDDVLHFINN